MTEKTPRASSSNAAVILSALCALALANLAIVLAFGGYEVYFINISIRSHNPGRPLIILFVLLVLRWLVSLKGVGIPASLRTLFPWGFILALAGSLVFLAVCYREPPLLPLWGAVAVWAFSLVALALIWAAYPKGSPPAVRIVIAVLYLGAAAGLADSLSYAAAWSKMFKITLPRFEAGLVPADEVGLLAGEGQGFSLEKARVGDEWMDAAVISPGGFFAVETSLPKPFSLEFSLARRGRLDDASLVVTAISGDRKETVWTKPVEDLTEDSWQLATGVSWAASGDVTLVFELSESESDGAVLVANPRIVSSSAPARLNVILVLVDALRADRMSLYGCPRPTSGEIDEIAASALVFDNCIAQAPWTVPSMASIFTSLYPTAHGTNFTETGLSYSLDTLAEVLRRDGYFTAGVQSNALIAPEVGFAQGFAAYHHFPIREPSALDPNRYARAETVNAKALEYLDSVDNPFFLFLHYMDVHDPYVPPADFRTFGESALDLYDGEIAYFSRQFAALFAELERRGLLESTILILASDHGEQFLEHGNTKHANSLYSEEVHVPLAVWHPRYGSGRVEDLVCGIDIAPTILALLNSPPIAAAQGRSLLPLFKGQTLPPRAALAELHTIYPLGQHFVSLTEPGRRFILSNPNTSSSLRVELYDLDADPAETKNIAAANLPLVDDLKDRLEAFVRKQQDLHARLVPEDLLVPLTDEKAEKLKALGYLSEGSKTDKK